ncbi:MAG: DUF4129 domain-containing protein [bacterium]
MRFTVRVIALALACAAVLTASAGGGVPSSARAAESTAPDRGQLEVRRALREHDYDWYDAASDGPSFERLRHELDEPDAGARKWSWLVWVLDFIAFATLLAILAHVIRSARRARRERAPAAETEPPRPLEALPFVDPALGIEPNAWLAAAEDAAARGDFTRATVCLFNGQLLILDRAHAIRLAPGRTNRHHLGELSGAEPARRSFSGSIREFERVFYGGRAASRESFERFREDHRQLVAAVPGASP